jgi:hypothetical protein
LTHFPLIGALGLAMLASMLGKSTSDMPGRMGELINYFQENRDQFGNPEINALNEAFDLTWNSEHKIGLRWSWQDILSIRLYLEENSLMFCVPIWDYESHLELKEKSHPFLYVNHRLKRIPRKIEGSYPYPNTVSKCLTQEGEWVKAALKAGLDYLERLG